MPDLAMAMASRSKSTTREKAKISTERKKSETRPPREKSSSRKTSSSKARRLISLQKQGGLVIHENSVDQVDTKERKDALFECIFVAGLCHDNVSESHLAFSREKYPKEVLEIISKFGFVTTKLEKWDKNIKINFLFYFYFFSFAEKKYCNKKHFFPVWIALWHRRILLSRLGLLASSQVRADPHLHPRADRPRRLADIRLLQANTARRRRILPSSSNLCPDKTSSERTFLKGLSFLSKMSTSIDSSKTKKIRTIWAP